MEPQQKKDKQDYPSEILQQFPNLRLTKSTGWNENINYIPIKPKLVKKKLRETKLTYLSIKTNYIKLCWLYYKF